MLTQERLKKIIDYDQLTGIFIWKISRPKCHVGAIAGCLCKDGYVYVTIDKKRYEAHRLAWLFVYGVWPTNQTDHKDTIRHHNWIENLRDVTHSGNQQNRIMANANNKIGFLGVYLSRGKYMAQITVSGKNKFLGRFTTPEEAHQSYLAAKRIHHSTCTI